MWKTALLPALRDRRAAHDAAKKAFLLAVLVHLFALVSVPAYTVRIRVMAPREIEPIELPAEITIPKKEPISLPRPAVPIEAEEDEDIPDDVTIAQTTLDITTAAYAPTEPPPQLPEFGAFVAFDSEPEFIRNVAPEYSDFAKKAGIEGLVVAKLLVGADGKVYDVRIMSGPEILYPAVRTAAMASLFSPAMQRDKPVAVWVAVHYRFSLRDAR
ncbi:energy transducer TonB [Candidatus Fermentibacteria bacterium]|nr:energy transducer TonB [Candidatus Fermentibacteria bacterium]